ncbi:MAG TPA: glutamate mutase L, partial [Bacilli bacterium]|nr:glutamate mutase L [Bacilli bacterium]
DVFKNSSEQILLPKTNLQILIDHNYNMATLGVLSKTFPQAALVLLKESLRWR